MAPSVTRGLPKNRDRCECLGEAVRFQQAGNIQRLRRPMFQCQPAARTQMRRRRRDDCRQGFESRGARRAARCGARRPGSRAPGRRRRCRAGWRRSGRSARPARRRTRSLSASRMRANSSCRAFRAATSSACGEMSTPVTCQLAAVPRRWQARWRRCPCPDPEPCNASSADLSCNSTCSIRSFGFRPRHEHGRRHVERQRPEFADCP